ncbi:MAG: glycosyltransferase family 2 protein [Planctomycetes bacterium]|nr:glycosyltransferase family 2 protein [Planctomycetota bacterium]
MPESAASMDETESATAPEPGVELSVIIPAFNEAQRLPAFLDSAIAWCGEHEPSFEILVVDDGSSDNTAKVVQERAADNARVRLIVHEQNAGKGAAVRTGMVGATGRLRLFADADGATAMKEFPALKQAAESGADVAIGSREGADKLVECSPLRRFLGRWFNRVVRMGSVKGIHDTQCGFKLFATPAAIGLFDCAQEDGYAFDVELLLLAQRRKLRLDEVFVNWTEMPGSKVSVFRDGWRMLKAVRRIKKRWKRGDYDSIAPRRTPARETTSA